MSPWIPTPIAWEGVVDLTVAMETPMESGWSTYSTEPARSVNMVAPTSWQCQDCGSEGLPNGTMAGWRPVLLDVTSRLGRERTAALTEEEEEEEESIENTPAGLDHPVSSSAVFPSRNKRIEQS